MRLSWIGAALLSFAAACSGEDGGHPHGAGTAGSCASDSRGDVYVAGLSKPTAGGGMTVRIVEATPAPPAKGQNTMVLEVTDAQGAPVTGASVTLTPFMPDHGHGSAVAPVIEEKDGGRYAVAQIYLAMAGFWRLTVTVAPPSGASDQVEFGFCLEG